MSHWSADDQDEPPINIVSLEICNAFFDWDIEYEYTDCVQFTSQTNAINQHNAPTTQVVKNYDIHEGNTTTLTSKAATSNATTSYVINNISAPTSNYNNAPIPRVIKDKNEENIPTLTSNAAISTPYVINNINASTSHYNINAEVGGVNLLALVQLFQSASTSLTM
eukprot:931381_1